VSAVEPSPPLEERKVGRIARVNASHGWFPAAILGLTSLECAVATPLRRAIVAVSNPSPCAFVLLSAERCRVELIIRVDRVVCSGLHPGHGGREVSRNRQA